MEARSTALRLRTVASIDLIDWTSRNFVEQSALAPKLRILPVKDLAWVGPVGLIYRREIYQPPAIRRLIESDRQGRACITLTSPRRRWNSVCFMRDFCRGSRGLSMRAR